MVFISSEYGYLEYKYISWVYSFVVGISNTVLSQGLIKDRNLGGSLLAVEK
jgi:hypothetical protein